MIKKKNYKLAAETKTIADYALILQHCNGYSKDDALKGAMESHGEELFEELLARNTELFKTGDIVMMGNAKHS
jgi:hypothetical protein